MQTISAPLMTVNEVAAALRTAPSTIYRHIQGGRLNAVRFGGCVRVPVEALDEFLADSRVGHEEESA